MLNTVWPANQPLEKKHSRNILFFFFLSDKQFLMYVNHLLTHVISVDTVLRRMFYSAKLRP